MNRLLFAAAFFASATPAFAADAPPPAPVPSPETSVQMDAKDIQVSIISIVNAGAACDAGVKAYCQIPAVRDDTTKKLQAAWQALQAPPTKK